MRCPKCGQLATRLSCQTEGCQELVVVCRCEGVLNRFVAQGARCTACSRAPRESGTWSTDSVPPAAIAPPARRRS